MFDIEPRNVADIISCSVCWPSGGDFIKEIGRTCLNANESNLSYVVLKAYSKHSEASKMDCFTKIGVGFSQDSILDIWQSSGYAFRLRIPKTVLLSLL